MILQMPADLFLRLFNKTQIKAITESMELLSNGKAPIEMASVYCILISVLANCLSRGFRTIIELLPLPV